MSFPRLFWLQVILGLSGLLLRPAKAAASGTCDDSTLAALQGRVKTVWYRSEWDCQAELQSAADNPSAAATARASKSCQDAAAARTSLAASYLQLVLACGQASEPLKAKLAEIGKSLNQVPASATSATVFINASSTLLTVSLDRMPTTRVKVNLDDTETGRHLEADWDPTLSSPLVKLLTLPAGHWQPSLWIEPLVTVSPTNSPPVLSRLSIPASAVPFYEAGGGAIHITLKLSALPKLREVHKGLQQGSLGESGARGLESAAPAAAQEALRIFAEIAYERARSKAFELLTQILSRFICDDLKLPGDLAQALGLPGKELQVLPTTCSVVRHLRVQELGSSAQALLRSLLTDVAQLSTDVLVAQLHRAAAGGLPAASGAALMAKSMGPIFSKTLPLLIDSAAGRRPLTARDASLILVQLSQVNWLEGLRTSADSALTEAPHAAVGCGMQLAFAVLAECQQKGGCEARELAERVARPQDFYDLAADPGNHVALSCAAYLTGAPEQGRKLDEYFPDLEQFIARGLGILYPEKGAATRTTMRNAVDLTFEIAERLRCVRPAKEKTYSSDACGDPEHIGEALKNLRMTAAGLIDRDVVPTMLGLTELLKLPLYRLREGGGWSDPHRRLNLALVKANQVLTALGSYAATYANPGDTIAVNAQHAARKKAIESLIDATTRRTNRDGEWVASIGASVGFYGGVQWIRSEPGCYSDAKPCAMVPQLSLPMGLALQYLPDRRDATKQDPLRARRVWMGWHLQVSAIDLGQFIALDGRAKLTENIRWADFVTAGLQTGLIVGTPDTNFLLAADFRWLPTAFSSADGDSAGAFRLGLTLSYYVPFFDLN